MEMKLCLQCFGTRVCERRWIINQLLFVCLLWSATLTDETEDSRNHTFENARTHTHTHALTASFYLSVSLPPLISRAKACVISFSSECCSACPWLGICLWLLLLLQPLQNLIRMRRTLTFSLFLCAALSCCFSSCIRLLRPFLHPVPLPQIPSCFRNEAAGSGFL